MSLKIGILTASDRASRGEYEDISGANIINFLKEEYGSNWEKVQIKYHILPDERLDLRNIIMYLIKEGCCLILTTGGTGPAYRDWTTIVTKEIIHKEMPGFGEMMRKGSFEKVPTAILSGQTAGIYYHEEKGCLIVNLPGSPKAIKECLEVVYPAIPYCIQLMGWEYLESRSSWKPKDK